jgi:SPP1 gp7 family putative phage head morphogenesis protein
MNSRFVVPVDELEEVSEERDYSALEQELNGLEERALQDFVPALTDARDKTLAYVKRSLTDGVRDQSAWLDKFEVRGWQGVTDTFAETFRQGWEAGRRYLRAVAPSIRGHDIHEYRAPVAASWAPRSSLQWLRDKSFWASGVTRDTLTNGAKSIILAALKSGEAEEETMRKLFELWTPYLGDGVDLETMGRLRTIVRTNVTEALNQGIVTEARAPDMQGIILALEYTAVLDERTTPVCQLLHGTQIKTDDKRLDALIPPNHFNCRSVLDPVIEDAEYDENALLTDKLYAEAVTLIPPGFGGS